MSSADKEPACPVCRDTGWVRYKRNIGGRDYPWAGACHCEAGRYLASPREHSEGSKKGGADRRPVEVVLVDREIYQRQLEERSEPDHPNSTPERKKAALAYIAASFGRDPEPIRMVEAILAGERDDVCRQMAKGRTADRLRSENLAR